MGILNAKLLQYEHLHPPLGPKHHQEAQEQRRVQELY